MPPAIFGRSFSIESLTIPRNSISSSVPIANNQVEFHPCLYQKDLLDYCTAHNITITAWAPVLKGKGFNEPVLTRIADVHEKSVAQIALKWLLNKNIIVIPKSSSEKHLIENVSLFDWELSPEEIKSIDTIPTELRLIDLSFSR